MLELMLSSIMKFIQFWTKSRYIPGLWCSG